MGQRIEPITKKGQQQGASARSVLKNIVVVLLGLGTATIATEAFRRFSLGPQNAILLFVLAIFLVAVLTDGYIYCLCAALAGTFVFDYLITDPRLRFSFTLGFPVTLTVMLIVAVVTSSITARMRLAAKRAKEKGRQADILELVFNRPRR